MPAAFSRSARLPAPAALASARTTSTVRAGAWPARTSRCLCGEKPSVSPGCGARLRTTSRRAPVACSAAASSGTSRCGSTLVNHDPGPNTTQSASSTARDRLRARRAGRAGSSEIDRTWPGVVAHATCPRTVLTSSGLAGSAPTTSATISSGTAAIGSTRPPVPSSLPTQSRPGHGVAEQVPQRDDEQVADGVAGQLARRSRRTGAAPPGSRWCPTRRRRTARPAPSAGHRAAGRRNRGAACRSTRRRPRPSRSR